MARYISLNPEAHRHKAWLPVTDLDFARQDMSVPLLVEELPQVLTSMPVVFVRDGERYELRALQSPEPGRNLFVAPDGRWLSGYIPAHYRAYPFRAIRAAEDKEPQVCFNEDSGLMVNADETADGFFDDKDQPSEALQRVMEFLGKCERNRAVTQRAVDALAAHGVLKPLTLRIKQDEESQVREMEGFYTSDEKALRQLDGKALVELQKVNALAVAYGQLYSMHRMDNFNKLYRMHKKLPELEQESEISNILADDGNIIFD